MVAYRMGPEFDEREEAETDYGRLYFATPSQVFTPQSIQELATTLKQLNKKGIPTVVRNTGHSMNGQTVTDGVQVRVGEIKRIRFFEEDGEVEAHCGDSWNDILKAVRFPEWCVPVFPNNPGQRIHMSGTIAAGGIGGYSASRGGLWNHVVALTLVTMEGTVIECSRERNPELFRYSLGGWGKIGVIARFRVRVERSKRGVAAGGAFFHSLEACLKCSEALVHDPHIDLVSFQFQLSHEGVFDAPRIAPYRLGFGYEVDSETEAEEIARRISHSFTDGIHFFGSVDEEGMPAAFPHRTPVLNDKHDVVYVYPDEEPESGELSHVWHDYCLPLARYGEFVEKARTAVKECELEGTFLRQQFLRGLMHADMLVGYPIRNISDSFFPLTLDMPGEDIVYHIGFSQDVTRVQLAPALKLVGHLTDLCYKMGGKRYLYGTHELTLEQLENQYGRRILQEWSEIKEELDPRNLLNGDVPRLRK